VHMGAPGSAGDKPGSADEKSRSADIKYGSADNRFGSADDKPGSTWEHLGAPQIIVKQSVKHDIFFGNVLGAPGYHPSKLLWNDF
jgi:hypothetical protein